MKSALTEYEEKHRTEEGFSNAFMVKDFRFILLSSKSTYQLRCSQYERGEWQSGEAWDGVWLLLLFQLAGGSDEILRSVHLSKHNMIW